MKAIERGILSSYDYKRSSTRVLIVILSIVVLAMVLSMLYPIAVTFLNSFKSTVDVNTFPPKLLPRDWIGTNYKEGWNFLNLPLFLRNSIYIFAGNLFVSVAALGGAAFALSKLNLPYRKLIFFFFLMTLFIPPSTYIVPNFVNLKDLGLMNSFFAFWLPAGASAFNMLLLKSFFDDINNELFEASRIDGASDWYGFTRIALPLALPIISTLAIFIFSAAWNDWFWPSLVMHGDNRYPMATGIYKQVIQARGIKLNIKFAILSMVSIPPMIIFLVFQRFILRGLHLGGVKG
ncbi:carbohydrate ABC transporter permease [Cohnella zeiphila]|uniref:Carbohydrate ABC transporter permease n=1 Tax=Cohnella zeiphila TaxID=2761120 RepID=A0A7X0SHB6_9BACL|nr:carbohydrate ABC transporter permease [Cohnella zeiphila]MBB6729976.1 carbohydrate ABC transporter permease [Cohnella zeiphila]